MPTETSGRKLTTLLAADVAGYSRLTSIDEEGTIASLRKHRTEFVDPLLERYNGRVVNTAGDSILVEFPSVVDAFRCSIEVQTGMVVRNAELPPDKRIEFRIGINVGDVLIDGDDLLGDGVNVAARLEGMAEPGGICISGSARDQIHHLLDIQLHDLGEMRVKNIERPVRAYQVVFDGQGQPRPKALQKLYNHRKTLAGLAVLAVILTATAYWLSGPLRSFVSSGNSDREISNLKTLRPTLIVLPFTNMSNDPKQDYFSDGITEGLTTALARTPGLLVAARNTAFTFKGKPVNIRDLQEQLGVRYVLEGSARKLGDRLRLSAQLIEASTSTHVWAETFDRPLKDIFIVQDDLVERIVGSVASRLRRHEGRRALEASTETLAAYDLTSRARLLFRRNDLASMREARTLLVRATEADPSFAPAFYNLAQVENYFFTNRLSSEYAQSETAERVVRAAGQAAALAPEDATARAINGMALRLTRDFDAAEDEAKKARELAPSDPDVLVEVASVLVGIGDYKEAVDTIRLAWALDPYISPLFPGSLLSQSHFALGEYEESKDTAMYCLKRSPRDVRCHENLVRALGELGPKEETQRALANMLTVSPNYTVTEYLLKANRNRRDKAAIKRWADGLRKAGVPE